MKKKEEQIRKKIAELFEKEENAEKIKSIHASEMEMLKDNPAKLRILYKFYESQSWCTYRDNKKDLHDLYKSLLEQTKEFAVNNYQFNELSTFFNI